MRLPTRTTPELVRGTLTGGQEQCQITPRSRARSRYCCVLMVTTATTRPETLVEPFTRWSIGKPALRISAGCDGVKQLSRSTYEVVRPEQRLSSHRCGCGRGDGAVYGESLPRRRRLLGSSTIGRVWTRGHRHRVYEDIGCAIATAHRVLSRTTSEGDPRLACVPLSTWIHRWVDGLA